MIELNLKKYLHTTNDLSVNFRVKENEFAGVFGKSGVGKTTILRMIAGLTNPDEGYIKVNNAIWFDSFTGINIPAQRRNIGFVFQDYSLFPNMTVKENLSYAQIAKESAYLNSIIEQFHLTDILNLKPSAISGGQKQRVALARVLARKPLILLLDEPFAALDNELKQELQDAIHEAHSKFNTTTIIVSHNLAELYKLATNVFVIDKGTVIKQGQPNEVFTENKSSSKFQFIAEILQIEKEDILYLITLIVANSIVKVIATANEVENLKVGDTVMVASKAFNPIITKL